MAAATFLVVHESEATSKYQTPSRWRDVASVGARRTAVSKCVFTTKLFWIAALVPSNKEVAETRIAYHLCAAKLLSSCSSAAVASFRPSSISSRSLAARLCALACSAMSCSTRARRHSISATAEPNDADMAPIWLSSSRCAASYCRPLYKASARLSTRSSACTPLSCSCGTDAASGAADADAPSGSDSASRTSPETPACVDSPHACTPPPPSLTHDQADSE
mmetsp:Transcript_16177/g.34725  ORF Transcript_16177/g.34725 Transcript_16177/m.34725 type:complete len:221 (-) Transcript_16177:273-935(-)